MIIKKILYTFSCLSLIMFSSNAVAQDTSTEPVFKTITEALYSPQRSGHLERSEALIQKISDKSFYDSNGDMTERYQYLSPDEIYEKTVFISNSAGKTTVINVYDGANALKSTYKHKLDDNGNLISSKAYDPNENVTFVQKNILDESGNILSMSRKTVSSNKTWLSKNKYNSEDQLIEEISYDPDGSHRDTRTFKYDKDGNEIESELIRPNGDYTKFISEYDEHGNMLVQNWYEKDGTHKHKTAFEYKYDKHNNWITKKRYSNDELGMVWERDIEYH